MSVLSELDGLSDLLARQEIEQIFSDTANIIEQLENLWRRLDSTGYLLNSAALRGMASRISQAARDFVLATQ